MYRKIIAGLLLSLVLAYTVSAADNLTLRALRLEPLLIDAAEGFSQKQYELETGVYYRWRIQGDGRDEYTFVIPELFDHAWLEKVVIEDVELPVNHLKEIVLEGESEVDLYFIMIQPGNYSYYAKRLRPEGFEGEFIVR
ncbi:MAG: hypothetical protein ACI8VW_001754 [bacterium]